MSVWNDPTALERIARAAPYLFIVLGFALALSGQWVRSAVDARAELLKEQAADKRKRTAPEVDAYLATSEESGDLVVVLDAQNEIPFRVRWLVVTKNDLVVSGIMIEDHEFHPTDDRKRFVVKANVKTGSAIDGYLELRLSYSSIYSSELGDPTELRGEIRRAFRFKDGKIFPE